MKQKPKSINGLMKHLRSKGISISGSRQKRDLRNIGYYHGYKGYKFVKTDSNQINYTNFDEVKAVYDFDSKVKALFYSPLMFIETSLKNIVLDIVVNEVKSDSFIDIYDKALDDYKRFSTRGRTFNSFNSRRRAESKYNSAIIDYNKLRVKIFTMASNAYAEGNRIALHFQQREDYIPIWGLFEMMTLGDFGNFVKNLNSNIRKKISRVLGINQGFDYTGEMPHRIIFALKDLRNSVAHNNVVFDARFRKVDNSNIIKNLLFNETGIRISFDEIFDYLCLIIYILKNLGFNKNEMKKIVLNFQDILEDARNKLPKEIFYKFIKTGIDNKITALILYISND